MSQKPYATEEIARLGRDIYATRIEPTVGIPENRGKVIVIDIETGAYELDDDHLTAARRALEKRPGSTLYATRVGFPGLGRLSISVSC